MARSGIEFAIKQPRERLVASVRVKSHPSQLKRTILNAQDRVLDVVGAEGLAPAGPMFTRYHRIGPIADLEVGVPLSQTIRPHPEVMNSTLPGGPAVYAVSIGNRAQLVRTVRSLNEYLKSMKVSARGGYWEYYVVEPLPGFDRCQVELYLPFVESRTGKPDRVEPNGTNGHRPMKPKELVAIDVCPGPETAPRSIFARRGPRWEEGAIDIDVNVSPRSQAAVGTNRADDSEDDAHQGDSDLGA